MKALDRMFARWRAAKVLPYVQTGDRVLDVGCHDGSLLAMLARRRRVTGLGIDPEHGPNSWVANVELVRGVFPDDLPINVEKFDVVTALAVLEHVPEGELGKFVSSIESCLRPGGKIVLTVPSPRVDLILDLLIRLRLADGMEHEQHHGFDVSRVGPLFRGAGLRMAKHRTFQLGLNHLFVFQK